MKDWPITCKFCGAEVDHRIRARCAFGNHVGCPTCVTGKGCPPCAAEQRERIAKAREEA